MPRWQLRYAIACCAITGWSVAYALAGWSKWTALHYDPMTREWWWASSSPSPVPINYWGLILWGAGGAAVGASLAILGALLWRRPLPRQIQVLLGAWALTAFALTGTYYMWTLWPF